MTWTLGELLGDRVAPLTIVDVGALWVGDEHMPYRALLGGRNRVVGFEPSEDACATLRDRFPQHTFVPHAVGDGTEGTFRHCEPEMTSSLYEPHRALLDRFEGLAGTSTVRSRSPMPTRRLDDVPEVAGASYLKIDVQGGELDVLRGATRMLKDTRSLITSTLAALSLTRLDPACPSSSALFREDFKMARSLRWATE